MPTPPLYPSLSALAARSTAPGRTHSGCCAANFIKRVHRTCAIGAIPIGAPGWPLLARWTMSALFTVRHHALLRVFAPLGARLSTTSAVCVPLISARATDVREDTNGIDAMLVRHLFTSSERMIARAGATRTIQLGNRTVKTTRAC